MTFAKFLNILEVNMLDIGQAVNWVGETVGNFVGEITGANKVARAAKDQAAAQREAVAYQQKIARLQAAREKREMIRSARIATGQAVQSSAAYGVADSSGAVGAQSSIASQLGSNLQLQQSVGALSEQVSIFNQKAADAAGRMAEAQAQQQVFGTIFDVASSLGGGGIVKNAIKGLL